MKSREILSLSVLILMIKIAYVNGESTVKYSSVNPLVNNQQMKQRDEWLSKAFIKAKPQMEAHCLYNGATVDDYFRRRVARDNPPTEETIKEISSASSSSSSSSSSSAAASTASTNTIIKKLTNTEIENNNKAESNTQFSESNNLKKKNKKSGNKNREDCNCQRRKTNSNRKKKQKFQRKQSEQDYEDDDDDDDDDFVDDDSNSEEDYSAEKSISKNRNRQSSTRAMERSSSEEVKVYSAHAKAENHITRNKNSRKNKNKLRNSSNRRNQDNDCDDSDDEDCGALNGKSSTKSPANSSQRSEGRNWVKSQTAINQEKNIECKKNRQRGEIRVGYRIDNVGDDCGCASRTIVVSQPVNYAPVSLCDDCKREFEWEEESPRCESCGSRITKRSESLPLDTLDWQGFHDSTTNLAAEERQ